MSKHTSPEPGPDLWYITTPDSERILTERHPENERGGWLYDSHDPPRRVYSERDISDPAPAAVIDTLRLNAALLSHYRTRYIGDPAIVAGVVARRILTAQPPRPPEPTELGTVISDNDGHEWVRVEHSSPAQSPAPWQRATLSPSNTTTRAAYNDISLPLQGVPHE